MPIDTSSTWNESTGLVTTNLTGPVDVGHVERWRDGLHRTIDAIPDGRSFRLLLNLRHFDPVDIDTHKAMRTVIPLLLASHGMRPAYIDLFDDKPDVAVETRRGVTCCAFANVHHDGDKMDDYQRRIGKQNQIFLTDLEKARNWLLACDTCTAV